MPQIVADLLSDREQELELWIRPERAGYGYTVEWTAVEYEQEDFKGKPSYRQSDASKSTPGGLWNRVRQMLSTSRAKLSTKMPSFDVDREHINVFHIDDRYLFKHYFEQDELFAELRRYYNEDDYRFEVPTEAFDEVQELLREHFYEPAVVDNPTQFYVAQRKYSEHPDVLFKASVLQQSRGDYHLFLMQDQISVEQAVNNGATPLADIDVAADF